MGALLGFCGAEVLVRLFQDAPPGRIVGGQGGKGPWELCIQCLDEAGQLWGPTRSLLVGSWSPPEVEAAQLHQHQLLLLLLLMRSIS